MVTSNEAIKSIANCGLICKLCFLAATCDGCRTKKNLCEKNCADEGCINKECCQENKFDGCWECNKIYGCEKGIYSLGNMSKIKAFAICIKESGEEYFIEHIMSNMEKGLSVEKGKDYDNKTIEEVLRMIRNN